MGLSWLQPTCAFPAMEGQSKFIPTLPAIVKSIVYVSARAQHRVSTLLVLIPPKSYLFNEGFLGSDLLPQLTEDLQEEIPTGLIETTI